MGKGKSLEQQQIHIDFCTSPQRVWGMRQATSLVLKRKKKYYIKTKCLYLGA